MKVDKFFLKIFVIVSLTMSNGLVWAGDRNLPFLSLLLTDNFTTCTQEGDTFFFLEDNEKKSCLIDCAGDRGGIAIVDTCGICNGDDSSCAYVNPRDLFYVNGFSDFDFITLSNASKVSSASIRENILCTTDFMNFKHALLRTVCNGIPAPFVPYSFSNECVKYEGKTNAGGYKEFTSMGKDPWYITFTYPNNRAKTHKLGPARTYDQGDLEVCDVCGDEVLDKLTEECDDGNNINGDGCSDSCQKEISCDSTHLNLCTTASTCSSAGGYWYNDLCNSSQQVFTCDSSHLNLCTTASTCSSAGGYWYNDICNSSQQTFTCDSSHFDLCTTASACSTAGGYWYNDICNSSQQTFTCDSSHLDLCTTSDTCVSAGGYWYDWECNAVALQCDSNHVTLCTSSGDCLAAGGFWYNNQCEFSDIPTDCTPTTLAGCSTEVSCVLSGGYWYDEQWGCISNQGPREYIDNGDGTITDTTQGLMWQKTMTSQQYLAVADIGCFNLELGGYSDWRLPTYDEAGMLRICTNGMTTVSGGYAVSADGCSYSGETYVTYAMPTIDKKFVVNGPVWTIDTRTTPNSYYEDRSTVSFTFGRLERGITVSPGDHANSLCVRSIQPKCDQANANYCLTHSECYANRNGWSDRCETLMALCYKNPANCPTFAHCQTAGWVWHNTFDQYVDDYCSQY